MTPLMRKASTLEKLKQLKTLRRDQLVSEHEEAAEGLRRAQDLRLQKKQSYAKALTNFHEVTAAGGFIDLFQLEMAGEALSYRQSALDEAEEKVTASSELLQGAAKKLQAGQGELKKVEKLEDKVIKEQLWVAERKQDAESDNLALMKWWSDDRD
jgi:flagellar biosynthesis chaperone FliJ